MVSRSSVVGGTGGAVVNGGGGDELVSDSVFLRSVIVAGSPVKSPEPNSVTSLIDTSVVATKAGVVSP